MLESEPEIVKRIVILVNRCVGGRKRNVYKHVNESLRLRTVLFELMIPV